MASFTWVSKFMRPILPRVSQRPSPPAPGRFDRVSMPLTSRGPIVIILVTMVRRQPYSLVYAPEVKDHLRAIERQHHSLIRETIQEQLLFEPEAETRNR